MNADADDLGRRLAATALADLPRAEVALPDGHGTTCVIEIGDHDLLSIWREAREALAGLNLYPVAVTTWQAGDWTTADLFSRFAYGETDSAPTSLIERSHEITVEDAVSRLVSDDQWVKDNWADVVEQQVAITEYLVGSSPDSSVLRGVAAGDIVGVERRLMAWEETVRASDPSDINESFAWFEPRRHDRVGLVLLPVTEGCNASAFLSFYGAEGDGRHEALIRLMREWQDRFGASLVASWGTMLQFVASAPPMTLEEAFELAAQQDVVAPCTTALPGETIRGLARHLCQGERWFLHERP